MTDPLEVLVAAARLRYVKLGELARLREDLAAMPAKLDKARRDVSSLTKAMNDAQEILDEMERDIATAVRGELEAEGEKLKPKYSNDKLREAETATRLRKHPSYPAIKETIDKAEVAKLNAQFALNRLEDEHGTMNKILQITHDQVTILTGRD